MTDAEYMQLALQLAQQGAGRVNPNPMVGAVIVKDDTIIGQGYHQQYGGLHAERNALADCSVSPSGATIYVTLEPCCHYGKTPPCTEALLEHGIRRVVIGSDDPNPLVAGKGIAQLRTHGVEVTTHVLKEACDQLNQAFFHFIQSKTPFVILKYAMTLDGKIATKTGASQWITGETARRRVHEDRRRWAAIMVGVGTVLADDPQLTCRIEGGHNPVRVICDTHLRTPLTARVVTSACQTKTILATAESDAQRQAPYQAAGCQVLVVPERNGHLDLNALMLRLGVLKLDSLLLEGGGTLNWTALESGIVQKVQAYVAPKFFGGNGKSPVMGLGVERPCQAVRLTSPTITRLGEDLLLESEVVPCSPES